MNEELYKAALDSVMRYQVEELCDFDDFMDEMEKEYGTKREGQE